MIKVKKIKILLLPGDGIGPEVVDEVKKIIELLNKKKSEVPERVSDTQRNPAAAHPHMSMF